MAIKHTTTKIPGNKLFAVADWNAAHTIENNTITPAQTTFTDQDLKTTSSPTFVGLTVTSILRATATYVSIDSTPNPALVFVGDTDTGFGRPANNELGFWTAGGERVRIHADGKVDIPGHLGVGRVASTLGCDVQLTRDNQFVIRGRNMHAGGYGVMAQTVGTTAGEYILACYSDSYKFRVMGDGGIHADSLKSGINQGAAGAAANELWVDTDDDNTIKLGV